MPPLNVKATYFVPYDIRFLLEIDVLCETESVGVAGL